MAKNLMACHAVLPMDIQESVKAAEVELVELLDMATVADPCFGAIEQGCQNYSSVDGNLCFLCEATLNHTPVQSCQKELLAFVRRQEISLSRELEEDRKLPR